MAAIPPFFVFLPYVTTPDLKAFIFFLQFFSAIDRSGFPDVWLHILICKPPHSLLSYDFMSISKKHPIWRTMH
ncbi:hypothetical protein MY9_3984 [Bacillus sp. JS]|nr:hypothetical protein MY9_3984 [Bacillus sp. JS]